MQAADWRGSGFLLIDPEGGVRPGSVTGMLPAAGPTLAEALGLGQDQEAQFRKWLKLVRLRHHDLRWEKLAPLAPLQELPGQGSALRLAYRKLLDQAGAFSGVVVFAVDMAQSQAATRQLEEERERHSLEIRDFLALSANPPETVGSFLADAVFRIERARREWDDCLAARRGSNLEVTQGSLEHALWGNAADAAPAGEGLGHRIFRDLHLIKGNAGAFGFDGLASGAQAAEEWLEALKKPAADAPQGRLAAALTGLETQLREMNRALRLISGEGQDAMARILKWKLDRLQGAAAAFDVVKLDPRMRNLVELSRRLPFLSPAYLARKYRHQVERLAAGQGKEVRFRVIANSGDIHPESFSRVDEALVHILRNTVDHGIESQGEREAAGKGEAVIELEYVDVDRNDRGEAGVILHIRDNGRGMAGSAVADRAVALGLVTRAEADALGEPERLALIFREGFTTRSRAGLISGRGLGLALAARCVADHGGNLSVTSEPGHGTVFSVRLPRLV